MKTGANDILGPLSPASLPDRAASYALDGAKSLYRLAMRRMERTQDKVNSEYDGSHWQKILSRKAWRDTKSLPDFLIFPDQTQRLRKVGFVPPLSFAMYATKIKEALMVEDPFEMMERLYHLWWGQMEAGK